MAAKKDFDNKNRFFSRYAGGYVTAPQYLVEQLCINMATQSNEPLADRFWTQPKWKKFFGEQIHTAYKILEEYDIKAALGALNDKRSKKTRSLRSSYYQKLVKIYQSKLDLVAAVPREITVPVKTTKGGRKPFYRNSVVEKLKRIDSGKKED